METNRKISPERVLDIVTAIEDGKVPRIELKDKIINLCDKGHSLEEIIAELEIKVKRNFRLHDKKEKDYVYELSLKKEYRIGSRINSTKIAKKLNQDYHNGEEYWSSREISLILYDMKGAREKRIKWTANEKKRACELSQLRQKYSNYDIARELNRVYRNNEEIFTARKVKSFLSDRKKLLKNQSVHNFL